VEAEAGRGVGRGRPEGGRRADGGEEEEGGAQADVHEAHHSAPAVQEHRVCNKTVGLTELLLKQFNLGC